MTQTGSARTNSRRRSTASSQHRSWTQVQAAGQRTGRAARGLETAACQAGELAKELRLLRRASLEAPKRSPIEVVLQGLTRRPNP